MFFQRIAVRLDVTASEDAAMYFGMQRFDAAIEHFRKAGVVTDLRNLETRLLEHLRGATRGEQLDPEFRQLILTE